MSQRFGAAAKQIVELINGVEKQVELVTSSMRNSTDNIANGANIAERVGENFIKIENSFSEVVSSVNSVLASANNMNKKSKLTLDNVTSVAAITEENSASSEEVLASMEENTAGMHEINDAAEKLDELVVKLKESVNKFKY